MRGDRSSFKRKLAACIYVVVVGISTYYDFNYANDSGAHYKREHDHGSL